MSLVQALAALCHQWVKGNLPDAHAPLWCGANLTPLCKLDGGVRPVAVGETLRRLVGKVLLATGVSKAQVAALAPTQVGIGVKSAAESVAMGLQSIVEAWHTQLIGRCVRSTCATLSIALTDRHCCEAPKHTPLLSTTTCATRTVVRHRFMWVTQR